MTKVFDAVREQTRSLSLDSAASDYTRFVKIQAVRDWWHRRHGLMLDEMQIATSHRGASSRLQSMFEIRDGVIGEVTKQIMLNAPARLPSDMQQKAAVGVGGIDTGTWGSQLAPYAQASAAFLQSLAPFSAFDRLLTDNAFTRLPLRTRAAIASDAAVGSAVSESQPKPVSAMTFSIVQMPVYKAIGQVVLTDEVILATSPGAERLFESEMQKKVALATDVKFLEIITEGTGVASSPSTGLTPSAFLTDLRTALAAIEIGVGSKLYLIVPVDVFKTISLLSDGGNLLMVNGKIGTINVVASSGATTDGVLLDASAVGADTDIVTSQVSNQSDVIMQNNPTSGSHQHFSLFQNNCTLIRCERFFGATVLRSDGIAVIANMTTA
jgi:hypothetical protein